MWKYILVLGLAIGGCSSEPATIDVIKADTTAVIFTVRAEALQNTADVEKCMKLDVTEADILTVIAHSKHVEGPEWHYKHIYPPCRHTGQITYNGDIHSFSYYPTGYLSLDGQDGWFMCYDCPVHPEWIVFDEHGEE